MVVCVVYYVFCGFLFDGSECSDWGICICGGWLLINGILLVNLIKIVCGKGGIEGSFESGYKVVVNLW